MGTTVFFTILHRLSGISVTRALRLHLLHIVVSLVTRPSASSSYLPLQINLFFLNLLHSSSSCLLPQIFLSARLCKRSKRHWFSKLPQLLSLIHTLLFHSILTITIQAIIFPNFHFYILHYTVCIITCDTSPQHWISNLQQLLSLFQTYLHFYRYFMNSTDF